MASRGPTTNFPIAGFSKRQGCVAHSTPEAELVAFDFALRVPGLPALDLWTKLLPDCKTNNGHEGNQAMLRILETGKNPTMRYLGRTHGISVAWLHKVHMGGAVKTTYTTTGQMLLTFTQKRLPTLNSGRAHNS